MIRRSPHQYTMEIESENIQKMIPIKRRVEGRTRDTSLKTSSREKDTKRTWGGPNIS